MINWRSIKKDGYPTDDSKSYLVTDCNEFSTTNISVTKNYNTREVKFNKWTGDENTYKHNECCQGSKVFELEPTHWAPTYEINLP